MSVENRIIRPSRRNVLCGVAAGAVTLTTGSLARATCISRPSTMPKPIYFFSPNAISTSVLAAYNAKSTHAVYQNYITDGNKDGRWDGKTSSYSSRLSTLPFSFTGPVCLDWEGIPNCTYGARRMAAAISGYNGASATTTATAQAEALRALKAWQSDRPNAKWGFYWTPNQNTPTNFLNPSADLLAQETEGHNIWAAVDCLFPRQYCTFKKSTITDPHTGQLTQTDLKTVSERMATLTLKCAANGGYHAKVYPFVSRNYVCPWSWDRTTAPTEWIYWHVYYFCQTTVNGRKADGVYIWDYGGTSPMTEAQLKAIYQGLNGLPYDPNMPRPAIAIAQ